jgi:LmbE family N-acetylglucosaminyl deacetylase
MNKRTAVILISSFLLTANVFAQAPRSYTSSEILLQLKKLNTVGAVLYIAAHPDDENTRLIAYLANGKCLRTGYLSLTRGDGGQNLIGPEQGIELGVIRTQELLAARRIDGGEQFFTRAYDFGFSKSPEETLQKWNKDSVLSDMVWVIRNFRPDIIITRFATDGSGGHGHHTTSAILTEEAFDAAGDPTRFPEQLKYVEVWKPHRLFWNVSSRFQNPNADMSPYIKLDVGGYNPLLGKSYGEIAAESRSMHKSQGFGSAKQRGEYFEYFKPIKGDTANLKDIFEGIDFSWKRVKGGEKIGAAIEKTITGYQLESPDKSSTEFEKLHLSLQNKLPLQLLHKMSLANDILLKLNGISIESIAKNYHTSIGDSVQLTLQLVNRSNSKVLGDSYSEFSLLREDYGVYQVDLKWDGKNNTNELINQRGKVGNNTDISQPVHLIRGIKNNLFDIEWIFNHTEAETSPYHLATAMVKFKNTTAQFGFNTQYKWTDPEKGELYRPVVITPPVMINMSEDVLVFDGSEKQKILSVKLKAGKDGVNGVLKFTSPDSINTKVLVDENKINQKFALAKLTSFNVSPHSYHFQLDKKGEEKEFIIYINPPSQSTSQLIKLSAYIDGQTYTKGIKEIKYDHIPVQTLFPEAEVKLVKLDLVKKSKRIGYIPGAGDEVQACLNQLGYEVVTLTDNKLATENLINYDAIITGVRAYNTNERLTSFKQKLMDYVAEGGNLVVQYNTNSWAGPLSSDIGPYKFKITRNRITDEVAKVNFLLPNHAVFNTPNKITEKDFEGWMQERSIYHAGEWDSNFVAPISMTDPYEMTVGGVSPKGKPDSGALIIAKHGKGNFVYTGIVFFRQLPAGVPGAYRFLVNLIELGK